MSDKRPRVYATAIIIGIGTALSVAYVSWVVGTYFMIMNPGTFIETQKYNFIGDFLSGICAPLALIWLIVAVMIQRQELKESRRQFFTSQDVVEKQMQFITDQNSLMKTQNDAAAESSVRNYKLSLFATRFEIFDELRKLGEQLRFNKREFNNDLVDDFHIILMKSAFVFSAEIEKWMRQVESDLLKFIDDNYDYSRDVYVSDGNYEDKEVEKVLSRDRTKIIDQFDRERLMDRFRQYMYVSDV